ncbi:TetR/AcrR family transcriptional regulator [Erysipelothrix anatis]|uniref:TetR/AcrR family transcriptional regulator n=1 Tax=Erysipelothrix anatis TaxID=2683713 RepID=UPI00135B0089|nr:TetR/AcrR family transcriptional regulator [Erysipelothrix anatis]
MNPKIKVSKQKYRTMRYFIDATKEIAAVEGIDKLTIRNIADRAGYNSATIYNYFENLDSLVALAMIDSVTDYLYGFDRILNSDYDPIMALLLSWRVYAECSFPNPEIYEYVFASKHSDYVLSKLELYFDTFPIETHHVNTIVTNQDMLTRNRLLYAPCFELGYFDPKKEDYIIDFCYILHGGFSKRIFTKNQSTDQAVMLMLEYLIEFLSHHIERDDIQCPTLDEVLAIEY